MSQQRPSLKRALRFSLWMAGWLMLGAHSARGQNVILHLRNGDRIAGTIISEDTNRVVVSTSWIKELAVPLSAIQQRELVTNVVMTSTSAKPAIANTNAVVAAATPPSPKPAEPPPKPSKPKLWEGKLSFGTDTQFGSHDHNLYTGRLNLTYAQPYKSDPKKFFRNTFDYAVDYGETEGVKSSDRMYGSVKTDFDVGGRIYVYNLAGVGYDDILKINLQYEVGPGLGYHLFTQPKFVANLEAGLNYQVQDRSDSPDVLKFYYRFAENLTWKITTHMTLVETAELFPQAENLGEYRARLDSTLSLALWKNISLNLSALDLYDTSPAQGVDRNQLQIRSTVGLSF